MSEFLDLPKQFDRRTVPSRDGLYAITGIQRPDGIKSLTSKIPFASVHMPLRREISTIYTDKVEGDRKNYEEYDLLKRQWTLFVYALTAFKELPVEDKLSYYQVAGIHGYPETSWDGAPPPKQDPRGPGKDPEPGENPFGGYCEHNAVPFPTWHRPYVLLFEVSCCVLVHPYQRRD